MNDEDLTVKIFKERHHKDDWVVFAGFQLSKDHYKKLENLCNPNIIRYAAVIDPSYFQQMVIVHPMDEEMFFLMTGEFMRKIGFADDKIKLRKLEGAMILFKNV